MTEKTLFRERKQNDRRDTGHGTKEFQHVIFGRGDMPSEVGGEKRISGGYYGDIS